MTSLFDGCEAFVGELASGGELAIRAALARADEHPAQALAAAEVVASAAGEPPGELPDEARAWVDAHGVPGEELVELALRVTKSISGRDALRDEHGVEWVEAVLDLRFRLGDLAAP